ncbi:MAG: glycerophosphoryl diester phosphodiesterase membrane domain-containing protein [Solobacterium sp.]|nr:glycerophosphoryl diester phosphodiesterase membrane domain-containing protein [Solobacterium sp.]
MNRKEITARENHESQNCSPSETGGERGLEPNPPDPMADEIQKGFRNPLRVIFFNLRTLIGFALCYRLFVLLVVFPLLSYMERLLPFVNGNSNITMYNAKESLLNPLSWLVLLLIGVTVCWFSAMEQYGLLRIIQAAVLRKKITLKQAFAATFHISIEQFRLKNVMLLPYFLIVLQFGYINDSSSVTRFIAVPGFILEHFVKYPIYRIFFFAFIVLATVIGILILYSVPIMTVEGDDFPTACRKSVQMQSWKNLLWLLLRVLYLLFLLVFATVVFTVLLSVGTGAFVHWLEPSVDMFDVMTNEKVGLVLELLTTSVFSWIGLGVLSTLLMTSLYRYQLEKTGRVRGLRETSGLAG